MEQKPDNCLVVADPRIAWVLNHPGMSFWLKAALRSADGLDPIVMQNDIEILRHLLLTRVEVQVEMAMRLRDCQ